MRGTGVGTRPWAAFAALGAAAVVALALISAGSDRALASHGLGGLPQCSDNIDNDGDGGTDWNGGLLNLPPDPACTSASQDNEGGSPTCALCVDFVTTYDPPGAAPPTTKLHRNVIANVPHALDVDGPGGPLPLGLLPLVPGYELRVNVQGLDATHPTIRIEKLAGAPASLPLRIEVLTGGSTKTSFGYDTLDATAPQSFVADVDLRDRDGNPATTQARVAMTIMGAGQRLTMLNEQFQGNPVGARTNRQVRRLTLSGSPANGTQVPTSATVDLTSSEGRQHVELTRAQATVLDFALSEPDGSSTTGTVDKLPASASVTIADADVNGDGEDDTKIDYAGNAVVDRAEVTTDDAKGSTTNAVVTGLPTEAHLTHASPTDRTEITYHANGRATGADVEVNTPVELDGGGTQNRQLVASVDNLPANIDELSHTETTDGGKLVYKSDASADHADVSTRQGNAEFDATLTGVPEDVNHLVYDTPPNRVVLDYSASGPLTHGIVRTEDVLDGGADPDHRREIETTVDQLAPEFDLTLNTEAKTVDYTASAVIPRVTLEGTDEAPFFERAKTLDLLLEDVPVDVDARLAAEDVLFDAHGGRLGVIDFAGRQTRFGGADLDSNADGFLLRDLDNRYDIVAHMTGLRSASFRRPDEDHTHVALHADGGRRLQVDVLKDVRKEVWVNRFTDEDGANIRQHISRPGRETLTASMPSHPAEMNLDLASGSTGLDLDYSSDESRSFLQFEHKVAFDPDGEPVPIIYDSEFADDRLPDAYPPTDFDTRQTAHLDPMPRTFSVCQTEDNNDCTGDVFTGSMFDEFSPESSNGGSARIQASPRTDMTFADVGVKDTEFLYVPTQEDFCFDGPIGEICIPLKDNKPALATSVIQLDIENFAVQSHQEDSGFVGNLVGYPDQGYVAMDTGWTAESIPGCTINPGGQFCALQHGHLPPPEEARLTGLVRKTGGHLLNSEFLGDDPADAFYRFSPITDSVNLVFGDLFGADHRIFEGDPDELIFAKTWNGHVYCDSDTDLEGNGTDFKDNFCANEIELPEGWEPP